MEKQVKSQFNEVNNEIIHKDIVEILYANTLNMTKSSHAEDIIKLNENIRVYYE